MNGDKFEDARKIIRSMRAASYFIIKGKDGIQIYEMNKKIFKLTGFP